MWLKALLFRMVLMLLLRGVGIKSLLKVILNLLLIVPLKKQVPLGASNRLFMIFGPSFCHRYPVPALPLSTNAIAKLGHGLSTQVCWEFGLPLLVCSPFYFDLFGHSCPEGFVL
ncbi:hypothetical protein GBA52_014627 [Prunus armeniaca]|nr:hypothetical protein GBA52_014627 [Prunus armeniaca]